MGDGDQGDQVELSRAGCRASTAVLRRARSRDQRHQPEVPKVTGGSLYRPWPGCHAGPSEPSTVIRLGRFFPGGGGGNGGAGGS